MNHEQNHLGSNHADCMPSLFSVLKTIGHNQMQGIVENLLREVKGDAMFGKVSPGLFRIPIESHRTPLTYNYVRTKL